MAGFIQPAGMSAGRKRSWLYDGQDQTTSWHRVCNILIVGVASCLCFDRVWGKRCCALAAGAAICAGGLFSASAQDTKTSEKTEIPGGIEGHVKSVDHEKETLSIIASTGKERTFKVTEDTTMIGPRGGKVRRRLNDKRFHEGMELTIVADGDHRQGNPSGLQPKRLRANRLPTQAATKRGAVDGRDRVD